MAKTRIKNHKVKAAPQKSSHKQTRYDTRYQQQQQQYQNKSQKRKNSEPVQRLTKAHILTQMGVISCKELMHELKTSQMNNEQKIVMIENHIQATRKLHKFLGKEKLTQKDILFYGQAGKGVLDIISKQLKESVSNVIGGGFSEYIGLDSDEKIQNEYIETDPECREVIETLKQLKNDRVSWTSYLMGKLSGVGGDIFKYLTSSGVKIGTFVISMLWKLSKGVIGFLTFVLTYISSLGFRFWNWLSKDPTTAYFSLLLLKQLKGVACKRTGEILGYFGPNTRPERLLDGIKEWMPELMPKINAVTPTWQIINLMRDAARPAVARIAIKVTGSAVETVAGAVLPYMSTFLTGAVVAIATPITGGTAIAAGPIIKGFFDVVMTAITTNVKDSARHATYISDATHAFSMLLEVIDPFTCIGQMFTDEKTEKEQQIENRPWWFMDVMGDDDDDDTDTPAQVRKNVAQNAQVIQQGAAPAQIKSQKEEGWSWRKLLPNVMGDDDDDLRQPQVQPVQQQQVQHLRGRQNVQQQPVQQQFQQPAQQQVQDRQYVAQVQPAPQQQVQAEPQHLRGRQNVAQVQPEPQKEGWSWRQMLPDIMGSDDEEFVPHTQVEPAPQEENKKGWFWGGADEAQYFGFIIH